MPLIQRQKDCRSKNKDILKTKKQQYYEENKDHLKKQRKHYNHNNKDAIKERDKKYSQKHKEEGNTSRTTKKYKRNIVKKCSNTEKRTRTNDKILVRRRQLRNEKKQKTTDTEIVDE